MRHIWPAVVLPSFQWARVSFLPVPLLFFLLSPLTLVLSYASFALEKFPGSVILQGFPFKRGRELDLQRGFGNRKSFCFTTVHLWSCRNRVLFVPVRLHSLVPFSTGDLRACTYCRKIALSYAHSTDSNSIGEDLNALSDSASSVSVLDPGEPRTPVGSRKASRNIFLEEDLTWQR